MSNRNTKSKSPQITKPLQIDKDLMKYLILQKITKPQGGAELITKTQPDEDSEVEDFKVEIEQKKCKVNQTFKFPKEGDEFSSDDSLQSLKDVTLYHLNGENLERLTDATQPKFMKTLNDKLNKLTDLVMKPEEEQISGFKSIKQHNYIPNLKSSRLQKVRGQNLSNTSINRINEHTVTSQGRESATTKPPSNLGYRQTPTLSSEKKSKQKQIQQILKIAQSNKQQNHLYKRTPQINNNYVNISANFNNSIIIKGNKKNTQDIRIKTECDDGGSELSIHHYQVLPKSRYENNNIFCNRPKVRESTMKSKKLELSQGHKVLNYTMDNQLLESLGIQRHAKSQNKNYKA